MALDESETDAGFEPCFRQLVDAENGLAEEHTWLTRRLCNYRRPGEFAAMPRTLETRFLLDIPRLSGVKQTR